jgi:hypothetical protein
MAEQWPFIYLLIYLLFIAVVDSHFPLPAKTNDVVQLNIYPARPGEICSPG